MFVLGMFGGIEIALILIILMFTLIIPLIALIDVLKNKFEDNNKIIWVLVIIFLSTLGAILYYAIGRKQRIQENQNT